MGINCIDCLADEVMVKKRIAKELKKLIKKWRKENNIRRESINDLWEQFEAVIDEVCNQNGGDGNGM